MLRNITYIIFSIIIFSNYAFSSEAANTSGSSDISSMTIEELMNVKVSTVSNFLETKKDASGNIIYLEKSELIQRGYNDLVEVFNDLPGIDLAQTWGDLYYQSYWRGYRQGLSSPFLLMLDGKTINHLYYHWTDILVSIPISMVDHIEIVYGPVSSVYGANALMGVFNIITVKDKEEKGTSLDAKLSYGDFSSKVADVTVFHKVEDLSMRVSAFLNYGDLDKDKLEEYEYTKSKYVNDKKLWGEFLKADFFGGEQSAYRENKGFAVSTFLGNTELGFQYYRVDNKYGVNYAFDKAAPSSAQIQDDYFIFLDSKHKLGDDIESSTYLRYRQSGLPNSSATLEEDSRYGEPRRIRYGYWQLTNNSWSLYQDFDVNLVKDLNLKIGFNYEAQQLQKGYEIAWGESVAPANSAPYNYPQPPINVPRMNNSMLWEYYGAHVQTKYDLSELFDSDNKQYLSAGLRYDHNTEFGTFWTYRLAYVLNYDKFGFKLLYGTATQEPAARLLYGGWVGSQDNVELEPEKSRNLESMWFYADNTYYVMLNPYYSIINNAINNINRIPMNIAEREMFGVDLHFSFRKELFDDIEFKVWSFLSWIDTREERYDENAVMIGEDKVGDIAPWKFYLGTNIGYKKINLNLRARYISERDNVESNPIPVTPDYFTLDANLILVDVFKNISLGLKINNLFDKTFYHPGIRDANAGITPGYFDDDNNWYGSRGWSNSLLPQPGRAFYLQLMINTN